MAAIVRSWAAGLLVMCVFPGVFAPRLSAAQNGSQALFLVARQEVQDPFFTHSVVLMLPTTDSPLVVGLIVNKPTRMSVAKLFPDNPSLQGRTEPAYFGGPVDIQVPGVVFHSSKAPPRALHVYADVYLTFDADQISTAFQDVPSASAPHLYLGRAQWAPEQLENEMRRGSWYRVRANGNLIFGNNLEGLWRRLHDQAAPSKYIRYHPPEGPLPGARIRSTGYRSPAKPMRPTARRATTSSAPVGDYL